MHENIYSALYDLNSHLEDLRPAFAIDDDWSRTRGLLVQLLANPDMEQEQIRSKLVQVRTLLSLAGLDTDEKVMPVNAMIASVIKTGEIIIIPNTRSGETYSTGTTRSIIDSAEQSDTGDTVDFNAYPRIDTRSNYIVPQQDFLVTVGFRKDRDLTLQDVDPIVIKGASADATVYVVLSSDDVTFPQGNSGELSLTYDSEFVVVCRPGNTDTQIIKIWVDYVYDGDVIGTACKILPSKGVHNKIKLPIADNPCFPLSSPSEKTPDIVANVTYRDNVLNWWFVSKLFDFGSLEEQSEEESNHVSVEQEPREFAADLMEVMRASRDNLTLFKHALASFGQGIEDLIPPIFFVALKAIEAQYHRHPFVLIRSNEAYIPWELAYLPKRNRIVAEESGYLGSQVVLGRWMNHQDIRNPPATAIHVTRATVVGENYSDLKWAEPERIYLQDLFASKSIISSSPEARVLPIITEVNREIVVAEDTPYGHLVHMSIHGESDPEANEAFINLDKGEQLADRNLFPPYECGEQPRVDFMFINGCQLGTSGVSISQAHGFAGSALRAGVQGFVAALWNVDDERAWNVAKEFYDQVINSQLGIAQCLRKLRSDESNPLWITAMSYVYFGHCRLQLSV